jgi:hypothetical protein
MFKFISKLIGLALIIGGIYFLGQNITIHTAGPWWAQLSAKVAVFAVTGGVMAVIFLGKELRNIGFIAIGVGIVLVFASSRISVSSTSLWHYFLGISALVGGGKLLSGGKIDF